MPRPEKPLEDSNGPVTQLAAELRRLRERAGKPPYRVLAGRAHYSVATLAAAAAGQTLPTLEVTLAFAVACGGEPGEWEARWHAVAAELAQQASAPDGHDRVAGAAPYLGLAAFQAGDAARFYGRERLVQQVLARLREQRCLALVGASGCGKSSVLRAGLVPRFPGPSLVFTPGSHPLETCAAHMASLTGGSAQQVHADLVEEPRALHRTGLQALANQPPDQELLIVVDQLEELFTHCHDHSERARFLDTLITAARADDSRVRVVFGLRADFSPHCTDHPDLFTVLNGGQVLVGAMSPQELRRAISQPAIDAGGTVEAGLLATLVAEAAGQPGTLPLVSHALLQTWHRRRGNTLTLTGYQAAGGIHGALAQTADEAYHGFDTALQDLTRQLLLRLTALGEGTEDTKRRIRHDELDTTDPSYGAVLARLAQARLITLDAETIEITHEALIKAWPRLRDWLTEDREGLRTHRQLTEATAAWGSLDRDPGALYRGTRLAVAREWAHRHDHALTSRERDFLDTSSSAESHERRTTRRRIHQLRWLAAGLTVLLVATTTLAVVARQQQQETAQQRQIALSRQFAAQATAIAQDDVGQAIRWSLEAIHHYPTTEARSILLSIASRPAYHGTIPAKEGAGRITQSALSEDGQLLASRDFYGGGDDRIVLIDVPRRARIGQLVLEDPPPGRMPVVIMAVAISPDRKRLVSASFDGRLHLWDLTDRTLTADIQAHDRRILGVTFSSDGTRIAAIDEHGTVTVWDSTTLSRLIRWQGKADGELKDSPAVAFSPDGQTLASTGDTERQVILRDLATGVAHPPLHTGLMGPNAVAFSPDGKTLATPGPAGGVALWDVGTRTQIERLGKIERASAIGFNKYNGTLMAGGTEGIVTWIFNKGRVVDPSDGHRQIPARAGSSYEIVGAEGTIYLNGEGGEIELWDSSRLPFIKPDKLRPSHAIHMSRGKLLVTDGKSLFTWEAGRPRAPIVRDLSDPTMTTPQPVGTFGANGRTLLARLPSHKTVVIDVDTLVPITEFHTRVVPFYEALSPDGQRLATAHTDNSITIWDANKPHPVAKFESPGLPSPGLTSQLTFSPDGKHLAATTGHGVTVWNLATQAKVTGPMRQQASPTYSPNGQLLATIHNRTVTLWSTKDYSRVGEFHSNSDIRSGMVFNPDSRLLATPGADRTVSIWDTTTQERQATLTGQDGEINTAAWDEDGTILATASLDNTITTWTIDTEQATRQLCQALAHDFPDNADPTPTICAEPEQ